jgi:hypothetical protein
MSVARPIIERHDNGDTARVARVLIQRARNQCDKSRRKAEHSRQVCDRATTLLRKSDQSIAQARNCSRPAQPIAATNTVALLQHC